MGGLAKRSDYIRTIFCAASPFPVCRSRRVQRVKMRFSSPLITTHPGCTGLECDRGMTAFYVFRSVFWPSSESIEVTSIRTNRRS